MHIFHLDWLRQELCFEKGSGVGSCFSTNLVAELGVYWAFPGTSFYYVSVVILEWKDWKGTRRLWKCNPSHTRCVIISDLPVQLFQLSSYGYRSVHICRVGSIETLGNERSLKKISCLFCWCLLKCLWNFWGFFFFWYSSRMVRRNSEC